MKDVKDFDAARLWPGNKSYVAGRKICEYQSRTGHSGQVCKQDSTLFSLPCLFPGGLRNELRAQAPESICVKVFKMPVVDLTNPALDTCVDTVSPGPDGSSGPAGYSLLRRFVYSATAAS